MTLRHFLRHHALAALAIIYAAFTAYQLLAPYLWTTPPFQAIQALPIGPYTWLGWELLRWLFLVAILTWLGWWREAGLLATTRWRALPLPWLPPLSLLLTFRGLSDLGLDGLAYFATVCLAISLYEETLFRGVVLRALLPRGRWFAVSLSAALFGLWHLGAGQPENWFLVAQGAMAGVGLAALRLLSGSLYPAVAWHAIYNFLLGSATWAPTDLDPTLQLFLKILPTLLLFTYGLAALRPRGTTHPIA